ncbi:MAG: hypothetical protein QOF14_5197 [Hyphomicrobiales bacterium]|jgi:hypothetical protein|nr:hypothetical protein [Hyphomicrobiales bacterium]
MAWIDSRYLDQQRKLEREVLQLRREWDELKPEITARRTAARREVKAARIAFEKLWHDLQLSAGQKAGFNPDQPRDDHGKWTDSGRDAGKDGDDRAHSDEISASKKKAEIVRQFGKWTARQFISRYCRASINREMPGEFENVTIADIYEIAKGGDARARSCLKLLKQDRFRK